MSRTLYNTSADLLFLGHFRTLCRLDNRFSISGIILLPFDERFNVSRRDQFHIVAKAS